MGEPRLVLGLIAQDAPPADRQTARAAEPSDPFSVNGIFGDPVMDTQRHPPELGRA